MGLCKYKDIFGKPNEGVHKYRLFNIAIVDMSFTIIAAAIIAYFITPKTSGIEVTGKGVTMDGGFPTDTYLKKFGILFLILNVVGFVFHLFFCVETTFVKTFRTLFDIKPIKN